MKGQTKLSLSFGAEHVSFLIFNRILQPLIVNVLRVSFSFKYDGLNSGNNSSLNS